MSVKFLLLFASLLCTGAGAAEIDFGAVEGAFARADTARLSFQIAELDRRREDGAERDEHYLAAYARYRLAATHLQQDRPALAKPVLKRAIAQLQELSKTHPDFADGLVLLAAVYGLEILRRPVKALFLGPRANKLIERALVLEPDNPRAYLMKGVVKFQTPRLFGGSVAEARQLLETGLAGMGVDREFRSAMDWGLVDLHLWLGRVAAEQDRPVVEKHHYDTALSHSPKNFWVLQAMAGRGYRYTPPD